MLKMKPQDSPITANRCFVQFPHPGSEHGRRSGSSWHRSSARHKRKFMRLRGRWMDKLNNQQTGSLYAWGEWEAESRLVKCFNPPTGDGLCPRYLWRPYYVPKCNYKDLHNTDPFIFGPRFLYLSCRQQAPNERGLRKLDRGSVIAFGSSKNIDGKWRWMLDTVFVIADFKDYRASHALDDLKDCVPDTFLDVSVRPWCASENELSCAAPSGDQLRLYMGATPERPVDGMFSFFPATPADSCAGFPRPLDEVRDCLNPKSYRCPSGYRRQRRPDELHRIWEHLVSQVRNSGLVLGTRAQLPSQE